MRYVWRIRNESRTCNNNRTRNCLNNCLKNNFIELEIEQKTYNKFHMTSTVDVKTKYIVRRKFTIYTDRMIAHEQRVSQLQVFIWLRHATCDRLRTKQSTDARRRWNRLLNTFTSCLANSSANRFLTKRLHLNVIYSDRSADEKTENAFSFFRSRKMCRHESRNNFVVFSMSVQMQQNESLYKQCSTLVKKFQ